MTDFLDYGLMATMGTNLGISSEVATVANELSSEILGEYGFENVHTLSVTYYYRKSISIVANYTFYSTNNHGKNIYDGVHVNGVIRAFGWFPIAKF